MDSVAFDNYYDNLLPYWLFWLLDHFNIFCEPQFVGVPFLIIMWIYAIQLVCFWCGCCRCLRKCCPAKCLQCVSCTCRLPCGIVSRFVIEALVFSFGRLFSKKELQTDTDATYLLFLKKPVAFIDHSKPLLKPAYNTCSDGCCCFSLITVFSTLLLLIVGMVTNVFAKNFPVTMSDKCTLRDENNNHLYCYYRSGSLFSFPLVDCAFANTFDIKVNCYALTLELGKASGEALGQLTFSVFMTYAVILLFRLWIKLWRRIFGTNGRLASCLNHVCTVMFGSVCSIILWKVGSFLMHHAYTIRLLNEFERRHWDIYYIIIQHDARYFQTLLIFLFIVTLSLPFSIPCLLSYYEHKPVFNEDDIIGNHPQGDRGDNGDPQEVDHNNNGDPQEVDHNNNGDPQEVDHNNNGDPQEVGFDENAHPQEVHHDDNGDLQEVDRGDNEDSHAVDHDDSALQEVDHDDGGPQEDDHENPDVEITPDLLPTTEPSDSPHLRQRRPQPKVSNQPDPGVDFS